MNTLRNFAVIVAALALLRAQQNAYLQVIHAVADAVGVGSPIVADSIDLYLSTNGGTTWTLEVPDFKFRQASRFLPIPANSNAVKVGLAPGNSSGPSAILFRYDLPPFPPNTYQVGIVAGTATFAAPPQGSISISIYYQTARQSSSDPNQFEFLFFHGANDVGTVDAYLAYDRSRSAYEPDFTLAQYAYHSDYIRISSHNLIVLDSTPANKNDFLKGGFYLPYPGEPNLNLRGRTGVVFASGYANTNDPRKAFGLHLALSDGTVIPLESREVRRLQIVHNAADPALSQVNLYIGGPDPISLGFRNATPTFFVDAPAGRVVPLRVTPRNDPSTTLATVDITIPQGGTNYVIFAQGVIDPARFAANPDGIDRAFRIFTIPNFEGWAPTNQFKAVPFHGVTDAPAVDVVSGGTPLAQNIKYLDFASPVTLSAGTAARLDVRPAGQQTTIASFELSATQTQGGKGTVIFASGFLNPNQNQNGPAFGLYIVYPEGRVEPLSLSTALSTTQTVNFVQVGGNPSLTGEWTLYIGASQSASVPITLTTLSGQVLRQEVYTIPGAGSWGYNLSFQDLSSGIYLLRVGEATLRLVRL